MKLAKLMGQYGAGIEIASDQVANCPDPFLVMVTTDSPSQARLSYRVQPIQYEAVDVSLSGVFFL